jgi:hypothetical protein
MHKDLKNLHPGGIWTRDLLFWRWTRQPLCLIFSAGWRPFQLQAHSGVRRSGQRQEHRGQGHEVSLLRRWCVKSNDTYWRRKNNDAYPTPRGPILLFRAIFGDFERCHVNFGYLRGSICRFFKNIIKIFKWGASFGLLKEVCTRNTNLVARQKIAFLVNRP